MDQEKRTVEKTLEISKVANKKITADQCDEYIVKAIKDFEEIVKKKIKKETADTDLKLKNFDDNLKDNMSKLKDKISFIE